MGEGMSDLVERLKGWPLSVTGPHTDDLCKEAADEIERLTAKLEASRRMYLDAEIRIERLNKALVTQAEALHQALAFADAAGPDDALLAQVRRVLWTQKAKAGPAEECPGCSEIELRLAGDMLECEHCHYQELGYVRVRKVRRDKVSTG